MIGNGRSGSWKIRGEQLGNKIGAIFSITNKDFHSIQSASHCIFVKKVNWEMVDEAKRRKKSIIWDCVDFWLQPEMNNDKSRALLVAGDTINKMRPNLIVCATAQQQRDFMDAGFNTPIRFLHHHARPHQQINPIREKIEVVGYEGSPDYIERDRSVIESICKDRGAKFVVNPANLADVDVVIAFRSGKYGGETCRRWKSNVKLANAQATGTPIICNPESGYIETATEGSVRWASNMSTFEQELSAMSSMKARAEQSLLLLSDAQRYTLTEVAERYKGMLNDFR
jgi:hypothetical protein